MTDVEPDREAVLRALAEPPINQAVIRLLSWQVNRLRRMSDLLTTLIRVNAAEPPPAVLRDIVDRRADDVEPNTMMVFVRSALAWLPEEADQQMEPAPLVRDAGEASAEGPVDPAPEPGTTVAEPEAEQTSAADANLQVPPVTSEPPIIGLPHVEYYQAPPSMPSAQSGGGETGDAFFDANGRLAAYKADAAPAAETPKPKRGKFDENGRRYVDFEQAVRKASEWGVPFVSWKDLRDLNRKAERLGLSGFAQAPGRDA